MSKHIKRTGIRAKYAEVKAWPWTPRARFIGDILSGMFAMAGLVAWVCLALMVAGR